MARIIGTASLSGGASGPGQGQILDDEQIADIARARSDPGPGGVGLAHPARNVVVPKSAAPARIEENYRVFDFELSPQEMRAIEGRDGAERFGPDPESFGS